MIRGWFRWVLGIGLCGLLLTGGAWLLPDQARAEQIIFLQDGHTVQADNVEVVGDQLRITRPSGKIVYLPRSDVFSIHDVTPPRPAPSTPSGAPPSDLTQQMTNEVRGQIQQQKSLTPPPRF